MNHDILGLHFSRKGPKRAIWPRILQFCGPIVGRISFWSDYRHVGPTFWVSRASQWNAQLIVALFKTHVFLLNEYFIELNTANFKILNTFLN